MNCKKHGLPMVVKYKLEVEGGVRYMYRCAEGCERIVEDSN